MYKIKIIAHFSAAHSLRGYKGKCESLHGHNWKIEVTVSGSTLNPQGMIMDFSDLKKETCKVLSELDHAHLNELEFFKKNNPSSEQIARYIYTRLKDEILKRGLVLSEVQVWETDTSSATYIENP